MKLFIVFILSGLLIFLFVQMWYFYERGVEASRNVQTLMAELDKVKQDHETAEADHDYYQNSANLEKELRARFNYREADEKMIVIVSKSTSTPTPTSTEP